jgi:hypothetical protein
MRTCRVAGALLFGVGVAFSASATSVLYGATNVGGNVWELSYDCSNNSLSVPISELTIYFNPSVFSNVAIGPSQPSSWNDPIAVQSDPAFLPGLSGYGFFDTVASTTGIAVGGSLAGFTTLVDYSGSGTPSGQIFQVVDPATFDTLDQGQTRQAGVIASVPEPGTLPLLLLAAFILGVVEVGRCGGVLPAASGFRGRT